MREQTREFWHNPEPDVTWTMREENIGYLKVHVYTLTSSAGREIIFRAQSTNPSHTAKAKREAAALLAQLNHHYVEPIFIA